MAHSALFDLTGKKALVTGGGAGIGRASALALAMAGADVAIVGRNEAVGSRTVAEIRALGRCATFVSCDICESAGATQTMVATVVQRLGRVDIAVNNAGTYRGGSDATQSKQDWDHVIDTNLTGTWLCAQAEMRQMIRQSPTEGKIINVASIAGVVACSNGAYDASKAAVVHLTKTLAAQWGRYNINVNCISPGYLSYVMGMSQPTDNRQRLRDRTPLGHVQRLEDLYGPILFLASRASDFITGQNLVVDGGHTLGNWLVPLERSVPPRVDTTAEIAEIKKDLLGRGIPHDEDGIICE